MEFRSYLKKDFVELKPLLDEYHKEVGDFEECEDFYNKDNLKKDFNVLLVFDKGRMIGFSINHYLGKDYLLLDSYIIKSYRRKGLGSKMIKQIMNTVKCERFLANPVKKESLNLLKKMGFRELPENEKNTPVKKGRPPYYTYYLKK